MTASTLRVILPAFVLLATLSASESVDCRIKRMSF